MTVYTPNIPQPNDNPSDSQDQILQNFQTLNTLYGTTGDHYPWTNTAPGISSRHAKVTLPRLPTAGSPPGDVVPTPVANEGAIFVQASATQSIPFYRKDNLTTNFPLLPIRAMGRFDFVTGAAIGTAFNLAVSAGANTVQPTLEFTDEDMPDANYLVQVTVSRSGGGVTAAGVQQGTIAVGSFDLRFNSSVPEYFVVVLHYA